MTRYAAIYARLSPRPDGSYEGVDSQTKWGHTYAAKHWPGVPVKVFADKGISAANGDHRPAFEALREAVARGEVSHLWAVEQTRLERREVEWFRLAAELDAAGLTELHTDRDGVVRPRDEVAGIKAVLAAGEVRKLKARVNARLTELAADGRPAGGATFGYRRGLDEHGRKTLVVEPAEAAVIRDAAGKVLAGWSLSSIATELRERGLHGPLRMKVRDAAGQPILDEHGQPVTRPSTITNQVVRSMLTNPTVAGWRVHHDRRVRGVWEPILDEQTWDAVRDKLAAPRTVQRVDGGVYEVGEAPKTRAPRRYLLTGGTAVCGVCGVQLAGGLRHMRGGPVPYYTCSVKYGGRSCVAVQAARLEDHVAAVLLDELDKPEFRQALAEDEHAARRDEITEGLRTVEGKRRALAAQWAGDEDMTEDEWRTARDKLAARERELRAELAAVPAPAVRVDVDLVREAWPAMSLEERREIVGMFVERVIVHRARPGSNRFDPGRVAVVWRVR